MTKEKALEGITVIETGQLIAGPTVGAILADFGAEVIKVEYPGVGDALRQWGARKAGVGLQWRYLARNKKFVTLALNRVAGQELFRNLIRDTQADVLIEAFRPGTLERWNLEPVRLHETCPGLTIVRVSGFGQTGPNRERPGLGTLAEAMSGFAHLTGQPTGPPTLPPFAMADTIAALYSTIGVLISLRAREKLGGRGQVIDTALLEGIFSMFSSQLIEYDQAGINPGRIGSRTLSSSPRNLYPTKDHRYVAIAAPVRAIVRRLFVDAMGRPEMIDDPRFATNQARIENADELDAIISAWTSRHVQGELLDILKSADITAAPVMDIADLTSDPHLKARGAITTVHDPQLGDVQMHSPLPRLSITPGTIRRIGPVEMGVDNREIYHGRMGLSEEKMQELMADGVI